MDFLFCAGHSLKLSRANCLMASSGSCGIGNSQGEEEIVHENNGTASRLIVLAEDVGESHIQMVAFTSGSLFVLDLLCLF